MNSQKIELVFVILHYKNIKDTFDMKGDLKAYDRKYDVIIFEITADGSCL